MITLSISTSWWYRKDIIVYSQRYHNCQNDWCIDIDTGNARVSGVEQNPVYAVTNYSQLYSRYSIPGNRPSTIQNIRFQDLLYSRTLNIHRYEALLGIHNYSTTVQQNKIEKPSETRPAIKRLTVEPILVSIVGNCDEKSCYSHFFARRFVSMHDRAMKLFIS